MCLGPKAAFLNKSYLCITVLQVLLMTMHMPQQHTLQAADAMHAPAAPNHQEQKQLQQGLTQQQQARLTVERRAAVAMQAALAEVAMQVGTQLAQQAAL